MKKKNLLKCLALTSMLALSVGAVTSCGTQGKDGTDGAQGAQGVQGAQGEKGDKGDKGDTTFEVIILQSEVDKGKITSSAYTGIKGDEVTLTFTPNDKDAVVISLSINYEDVALTDEILGGSLKLTFSDQSYIVTAKFGTAADYGEQLISSYYNSLADKDNQMNYLLSGVSTLRQNSDDTKKSYVKDFVKGQYYDTSVGAVAATYYAKVQTTLTGLKKDATVKERLAAVKKVYEEAKTKIDEKYKKVVDAAIVKGGSNIDSLYASVKNMTATDVATMKASAHADVEKATTLQAISAVIDKNNSLSNGTTSSVLVGSYNEIERLRASAFKAADDSIKSVYSSDSSLNPGTTTAAKEAYATFIATLKEFGISEDSLPTKVYEDYKAKISAATSFDYYVKDEKTNYDKTVLGEEASKAISDASKNIIETVKKAVLAKYYAEVEASTALSDQTAKDNCKGKIETTVSAWFNKHTASKDASVTNFLSYLDLAGGTATPGGLKAIEDLLADQYVAFNAERLTNYKKTAVADIQAKGAEYIDSDTLYKSVINATIGSGTGYDYATTAALATELGLKETSVVALRSLGASYDGTPITSGADVTNNVQKYVDSIVTNKTGIVSTTASENDGGYIKSNMSSVLGLLTYKTGVLANIKVVYEQAVKSFMTKETAGLGGSVNTGYGDQAITTSDLSSQLASLFEDTDNVTSIHEKLKNANSTNWVGLVDSLGAQYSDWWDGIDAGYGVSEKATYQKATLSEVWKSIQEAVKSIIKGEITTYDQTKEVIAGLDDKYGTTVENYYQSQLKALGDVKANKVEAAGTGAIKEVITSRYNNWVSVANTGIYSFTTYDDVDFWFGLASADLAGTGGETLSATSEVDYAHKYNDAVVKALGQIDDYEATVKVGSPAAVLTETEKGYKDVKALFGAMQVAAFGNPTTNGFATILGASTVSNSIKSIIDVDTNGSYVVNDSYNGTAISSAITIGKARAEAITNLGDYKDLLVKAVTGTAAADEGKKAAYEAQYAVELAKLTDSSDTNYCDTVAKIQAEIKLTGTLTSVTAITDVDTCTAKTNLTTDATMLTSYNAAATLEAAAYLRKALIENPDKQVTLRAVTSYVAGGTDAGAVYTNLKNFKDAIDVAVNAD